MYLELEIHHIESELLCNFPIIVLVFVNIHLFASIISLLSYFHTHRSNPDHELPRYLVNDTRISTSDRPQLSVSLPISAQDTFHALLEHLTNRQWYQYESTTGYPAAVSTTLQLSEERVNTTHFIAACARPCLVWGYSGPLPCFSLGEILSKDPGRKKSTRN
jgi:hypothetical protein